MANRKSEPVNSDGQMLSIGQFIQGRREELELSVEEVAAPAGISAAYLRKIESDHIKSPSVNVIFSLARVLSVSLNAFEKIFTHVEEMKIEKEIQAIHECFPNLRIAAAKDLRLQSLEAMRQYLALLKTVAKDQNLPGNKES